MSLPIDDAEIYLEVPLEQPTMTLKQPGMVPPQLHQECRTFPSRMLDDIKIFLQEALQEVVNQQQVLSQLVDDAVLGTPQQPDGFVSEAVQDDGEIRSVPLPSWSEEVATHNFQSMIAEEGAMQNSEGMSPRRSPSRNSAHLKGETLVNARMTTAPGATDVAAHGVSEGFVLFGRSKFLADSTGVDEQVYKVQDHYATTGLCQLIARSKHFNNLTLLVICTNAVYMGFDADHNSAASLDQAETVFQVFENFFCMFFTLELLVRFGAFAVKRDCLKDVWFKFDGCLVCLMAVEIWLFPLLMIATGVDTNKFRSGALRLVRLLRLARMTRIMRGLPELVTMAKAMLVASRAVFSALLMLCLLVYVFAIIMHSLLSDNIDVADKWSTISKCMWTLLLHGVFLDELGEPVRELIGLQKALALVTFMMFVLASAITIMNMLIGVLCEVVNQVSVAEKENADRAQVRASILKMLQRLDADGSGDITKEELLDVIQDPDAVKTLGELDVDIPHFLELQDMLFEDSPNAVLSISQIMTMILEFRGERSTTVHDLVSGQCFSRWVFNSQLVKQTDILKDHLDHQVVKLWEQMKNLEKRQHTKQPYTFGHTKAGHQQDLHSSSDVATKTVAKAPSRLQL